MLYEQMSVAEAQEILGIEKPYNSIPEITKYYLKKINTWHPDLHIGKPTHDIIKD